MIQLKKRAVYHSTYADTCHSFRFECLFGKHVQQQRQKSDGRPNETIPLLCVSKTFFFLGWKKMNADCGPFDCSLWSLVSAILIHRCIFLVSESSVSSSADQPEDGDRYGDDQVGQVQMNGPTAGRQGGNAAVGVVRQWQVDQMFLGAGDRIQTSGAAQRHNRRHRMS